MPNKQKLKEFHESVIEDYNRSLIVEDIALVRTTEKVDSSSIQIGRRMSIDEEVFDSLFQSFGREVAIGERDFLLKQIFENKEVIPIKLIGGPTKFIDHLDFDVAIVLLSTKFYVEFFTELMDYIEYGSRHPIIYHRYPVISVPEKVLKNRIIIIEKGAIWLEKELFTDEFTGKKEKINVITRPSPGLNVDVLVRSVNKIKSLDPELIRILEVED